MKNSLINLIVILLITSCASRPQLYPNDTFKRKGEEASSADIDQCLSDADAYLESSKGKQILKGAGSGSVIGGAVGAVSGLLSGNLLRGAATGAVIGGAGGAAAGAITPDQLKHNFVNQCLSDKGYKVIGWN